MRVIGNLKHISGSIVFRLFFVVTSVLISVVITRLLGLEGFGEYSWLVSMAFLLAGLAHAGASNLIVRETSRSTGRAVPIRVLFRVGGVSTLLLILFTGGAIAAGNVGLSNDIILPLILLALFNLVLMFLGASTRGMGLITSGLFPELALRPTLFLAMLGIGFLAGMHATAQTIVYGQVTAYALAVVVAVFLLIRGLGKRAPESEEKLGADWLSSFFWLGIMGWLNIANSQLLVILTGYLADFSQVGLYRVAAQAVVVIGIGLTAIDAVQAPVYARAYKDGEHRKLHDLMQQASRICLAISSSVMIGLYLVGQKALGAVFGPEFEAAYPVLFILGVGHVLISVTGTIHPLLIAAKLERRLAVSNVAALAVMLITAFAFIPIYGAVAAAIAAVLSLITRNVVNACFCWKELGIIALPFAPFIPREERIEAC